MSPALSTGAELLLGPLRWKPGAQAPHLESAMGQRLQAPGKGAVSCGRRQQHSHRWRSGDRVTVQWRCPRPDMALAARVPCMGRSHVGVEGDGVTSLSSPAALGRQVAARRLPANTFSGSLLCLLPWASPTEEHPPGSGAQLGWVSGPQKAWGDPAASSPFPAGSPDLSPVDVGLFWGDVLMWWTRTAPPALKGPHLLGDRGPEEKHGQVFLTQTGPGHAARAWGRVPSVS